MTTKQEWAASGSLFAGVMMLVLGVWNFLKGIAALREDDVFVMVDGYTYDIDLTVWGWVAVMIGALAAVAGAFVLAGREWARIVGIIFAVFAMVSNFLFLPYYPLWSLLIIALSAFAIWSLSLWRPGSTR